MIAFHGGTVCKVAAIVLFASACSFVPSDGPQGSSVRSGSQVTVEDAVGLVGYAIVKLSPTAIRTANEATEARIPKFSYLNGGTRNVLVSAGDMVSVSVFEASGGGLFIPADNGNTSRQGNFVNIPVQQVDSSGNISIPFAGKIRASGRSTQQISEEIRALIANRAVEPQVVVTVTERRSGGISVFGDVNLPSRLPLEPGGIRVLEAIARAGGTKSNSFETIVTLQRGGKTQQAVLSNILKRPSQNLLLGPNDSVFISKEPKYFVALGATVNPGSLGALNNRRFPFETDNLTLTEAVARAGGLDATRANPQYIFIYRLEERSALKNLGVDLEVYSGPRVPTIYTVDFSRPDAFFLASDFYMRDKDVIFISEAHSVGLARFTASLSGLTGNASAVSTTVSPR
ncbi:hypothetical protein GPNCGGLF_LOCUS4014 [Methylorubrum aminovorans]